jgi:hypothetical protein
MKGKGQGPSHWYVAKYFDGDTTMLPIVDKMLSVLSSSQMLSAFCRDLGASHKIILTDIKKESLSLENSKKINVTKTHISSYHDYVTFTGARKARTLTPSDVLSTYNTRIKGVTTIIEQGDLYFVTEDGPITFSQMVVAVEDEFRQQDIDIVVNSNVTTILNAELAGKNYTDVEGKKAKHLTSEVRTSVQVIKDSLQQWEEYFDKGIFGTKVLKMNLRSLSSNVAVPYVLDGNNYYDERPLTKLGRRAMDPRHVTHKQDIPRALAKKCGSPYQSLTADAFLKNFKDQCAVAFKDIDAFPFSDAWIDLPKFNVNILSGFVPVYVGLETVPFVMIRAETGLWESPARLRKMCNLTRKLYKMVGLLVRLRISPMKLWRKALGVFSTNVKGFYYVVANNNFNVWLKRMEITEYLQSSCMPDEDPEGEFNFENEGEDMDNFLGFQEDCMLEVPLTQDSEEIEEKPLDIVSLINDENTNDNTKIVEEQDSGEEGVDPNTDKRYQEYLKLIQATSKSRDKKVSKAKEKSSKQFKPKDNPKSKKVRPKEDSSDGPPPDDLGGEKGFTEDSGDPNRWE